MQVSFYLFGVGVKASTLANFLKLTGSLHSGKGLGPSFHRLERVSRGI